MGATRFHTFEQFVASILELLAMRTQLFDLLRTEGLEVLQDS